MVKFRLRTTIVGKCGLDLSAQRCLHLHPSPDFDSPISTLCLVGCLLTSRDGSLESVRKFIRELVLGFG